MKKEDGPVNEQWEMAKFKFFLTMIESRNFNETLKTVSTYQ